MPDPPRHRCPICHAYKGDTPACDRCASTRRIRAAALARDTPRPPPPPRGRLVSVAELQRTPCPHCHAARWVIEATEATCLSCGYVLYPSAPLPLWGSGVPC